MLGQLVVGVLAAIAALGAAIPAAAAPVFASLGIALALHGRRALRARTLNLALQCPVVPSPQPAEVPPANHAEHVDRLRAWVDQVYRPGETCIRKPWAVLDLNQ